MPPSLPESPFTPGLEAVHGSGVAGSGHCVATEGIPRGNEPVQWIQIASIIATFYSLILKKVSQRNKVNF